MMRNRRSLVTGIALLLVTNTALCAAGEERAGPTPPDLTRGQGTSDIVDGIVLGATGADGWIWGNLKNTVGSKQIYVVRVDKGSPAERVLQKGDVILGVVSPVSSSSSSTRKAEGRGGLFKYDARKEFANALIEAEKEENKGALKLKIWRDGKTMDVTLKLKVMGTCNFTKDCPKSRRIIDQACNYFKKHGLRGAHADEGVGKCISALALLATGREELLPIVRKHARELVAQVREKPLNIESHVALASWKWGYSNLFLSEYYLATGNKLVLPGIQEYATKLAMGQTGAGNWGHMMAHLKSNNDKLHGNVIGYGPVSSSGLICAISLVLAQKCGVNNEEIAQAVERSAGFFRYYVDRGGVPYGEHAAIRDSHATNGKTASAGVLFDLLGDKEAATFFSQMAVAGYNEREHGHSGLYFSLLWGGLGAARCGDAAAAAYMHQRQWYIDLERRWTGDFAFQGVPGVKVFPR